MIAGLKPVPATIQEPPYPPDTRTAGWHFRLDCPRVLQSDTWALAVASQWPEARPWLLMLWFTSWQEIPAGSLPNDDPLIAAKVGMSDEMFQGHRAILMRNWYRASDGRLYNPTMVELVKIIIDCKASARERQRRHRAKDDMSQDVTRDTPLQRVTVTDGVVDVDVDVDVDVKSKTSSKSKAKSKALEPPSPKKPAKVVPSGEVWQAYATAYFKRYGTEPVRNAVVNGQLRNFVSRVGALEGPAVASHYLRSDNARYVKGGHSCGLMLHDAEKLRMEWATGTGGGITGVFDQLRAKAKEQGQ